MGCTSSGATNINTTYFAATTGRLTIATDTRTTPSIITPPIASEITYSQTLSGSTLSGGSASVAGSFAFTDPATIPDAGTYNAPVTFTPTDGTSYKTTSGNVDVVVAPKPITITADASQTKVYGLADPAFTFTPSEVVGFTGALSRDAGEDVGVYAITQGDLSAGPNYAITFIPDNFSITPKLITVTADANQTKVYGEVDPTFTFTPSEAVSFTGALGRDAGENVWHLCHYSRWLIRWP